MIYQKNLKNNADWPPGVATDTKKIVSSKSWLFKNQRRLAPLLVGGSWSGCGLWFVVSFCLNFFNLENMNLEDPAEMEPIGSNSNSRWLADATFLLKKEEVQLLGILSITRSGKNQSWYKILNTVMKKSLM